MENETTEFGTAIIRAVRAVAAEMPDQVADHCVHFNDSGKPECIVGRAFARLGIQVDKALGTILDVLNRYEGGFTDKFGIQTTWPEVSRRERVWLDNAQAAQDGRRGSFRNPDSNGESTSKATFIEAVDFADQRDREEFWTPVGV
jgi:hypothetical protein